MSYKANKREKNTIKIEFEVTPADWMQAIDDAYKKNKSKYKFEGFRKGKVPRKILENAYGTSIFYEDAIDIVLPKYYIEALTKEKLEPVAQPEIEIIAISDATFKFNAVITLKPIFELAKYKGLSFEFKQDKVTKKDISEYIDREKEQYVALKTIDNRACKLKDEVTIDFSGSVDGKKFDGGTASDYSLELGSHSFIDNFEDQIVGMKVGDEKDIEVTFPKDYFEESLKGKKAVFKTKLKAIKEKVYPKLDDEFAKDVSEFDTFAEYEKDVKKKLEEQAKHKAMTNLEDEMIQFIATKTKIDVPEVMIEDRIDDNIKEFEMRMKQQGFSAEQYYEMTKTTRDDLRGKYKESAEKSVRMQLVLERLVKDENLMPTEKDIDAKLEEMAKRAKITTEEYKKAMPQIKDYVANMLATDMIFDFLISNNTIKNLPEDILDKAKKNNAAREKNSAVKKTTSTEKTVDTKKATTTKKKAAAKKEPSKAKSKTTTKNKTTKK